MADPVDLPELRRLAEAATAQPTPNWWASSGAMLPYLAATSPNVVLALLDRIDALESVVARFLAGYRPLYEVWVSKDANPEPMSEAEQVVLCVPGAEAGEPESEGTT